MWIRNIKRGDDQRLHVVGLADGNLALKLQLDKELTLQKAVTQARQSEAVKKQQGTVRNTGSSTASANTTEQNIDAVQAKQFSGPNYRGRGKPKFHKNKSNRGISHRPSQNHGNKQHFSNIIIRMIRNPDAVVVVANHHLTQEIDALPVELCVILVRFVGITAVCAGHEQAKELVW